MLCIAYVCVSVCCSSDLPWHVKIATPTALSASAFRPGISRSVVQIHRRYVEIGKIAPSIFVPEHASPFADTPLHAQV